MPNRRKLCHDRLRIYILDGKAVPSPSCCIYVSSVSLGCLRHPSFDRWLRRTRRKLEYRYTFFLFKWEEFSFVVNEGKYYPVWRPVFLGQATHEDRFLPHTAHLNVNILLFFGASLNTVHSYWRRMTRFVSHVKYERVKQATQIFLIQKRIWLTLTFFKFFIPTN